MVRLEELKEEDEEEEDDFDLEAHTLSPDDPSHMTATPSSTVESRDVLSDLLPGGLRGGPSSHHTHPHHPNKKRVRSDTESRIMRTFIPFKTRKRSQTIQEGASPKEKEEVGGGEGRGGRDGMEEGPYIKGEAPRRRRRGGEGRGGRDVRGSIH